MGGFIYKYRATIRSMLEALHLPSDTPVGVIFVSLDQLADLQHVVVLNAKDRELARDRWRMYPDPYGWAPSETRVIAVIVPLV